MAAVEPISYDRAELRSIIKAFKAMDDEAVAEAKKTSNALATFAADKIKATAYGRTVAGEAVRRVAEGVRVSKSSKIGELSYGFASQRFSGGATTQILWPGLEFGSNRYRQFPRRTPNRGRGNAGYFIYPTLRQIQPELVRQWEDAFSTILKEWDK
jgi:hypothetical protein